MKRYNLNKGLGLTAVAVFGIGALAYGADVDPNALAKAQLDNLALIAMILGSTAMILLVIMVMFFMVNTKQAILKKRQNIAQKAGGITAVLLLLSLPAMAQEAAATPPPAFDPTASAFSLISWIIIGLGVLNVGLIIGIIYGFDYYLKVVHDSSLDAILPDTGLSNLFSWEKLTGQKVVSKASTAETALDHEYDGIVELDNPAPPLFNYILYGTIIFAIVYWTVYHVTESAPLMVEEYKNEMAIANEQKAERMKLASNQVDENNVKVMTDASVIDDGKSIYKANCAACHGDNGEGKVGPNFADEYWIHGGGIKNIFKTIKYGVPEKGMIAWEKQLAPGQIANVANYILTLKGTNPPNPKEPQGDKWVEGADASPAPANTDSTAKTEKKDTLKTEKIEVKH